MGIRYAALAAAAMIVCLPALAPAKETPAPKPATSFSWMSNGAADVSDGNRNQRAKAVIIRAKALNKALNKGASWVCSPAGFGKPSRCHRG